MSPYARSHMPAKAPLPMAAQDFGVRPAARGHRPRGALSWRALFWRLAAFGPALAITGILVWAMAGLFARGGVTPLEALVVALVGVTFVWVSLSVSTVLLGLARRLAAPCQTRHARARGPGQKVALLVPVYNEAPADVFGNAAAMLRELARGRSPDAFTLFVLSDTRDQEIAAAEERAFWALRAGCPEGLEVYYRRRAENTDKKVGNLTDWIEGWGGGFDAMVVLDADSLMSGAAIRQLAHEMAADRDAGLIQSFPVLIGAETLFGRMQQFSNAVYGWLQAEGLALWSGREGNYWGHNAIIRTRAFAESARLPHLRSLLGGKRLILSHDFVEAGMLRRAGWTVRFQPRMGGSFEETPQTVVDYALRDRRWCQGNLQHLRLLTARGFHPITRFHLLQGAVAFLLSPAWFLLILIWAWVGTMPAADAPYFSAANPLYPVWPESGPNGLVLLGVIYGMLLLPKLLGAVALGLRAEIRAAYGGALPFMVNTLFEVVLSVLFAPVMMVQQTVAVLRAVLGSSGAWVPQNRSDDGYGWRALLRFHWLETGLGVAMLAGILSGAVSLWVLPVAASLVAAVPLSWLGSQKLTRWGNMWCRLESPQSLREPRVVRVARGERAEMARVIERSDQGLPIAAE